MKPIVFLGGGRITTALIAGLRLADYKKPLLVHDRHPEKMRKLSREFSVVFEADLCRAVQQAGMLLVAVRPDSVLDLLSKIGKLHKPVLAVSVAAGIPLSLLRARVGFPVQWARAMPSPACRSCNGLTAVTFPRSSPKGVRAQVKSFFASVGQVLEIQESQFDAFTVTYSCSHGYHTLATLARAGVRLGLARETALIAAAHALADGIVSWRESKIPLEHLLREAATPGGIAATTMAAMDEAGYARAVERGLQAGLKRAKANVKLH